MLNQVLALTQEQGWFDLERPHEKTLYLTHGSTHCVILSRKGVADTFIKFSELMSLRAEAERCARAAQDFGGLAPAFIGRAACGSLEILASRAETFHPLTGGMASSGRDRPALLAGLERYFAAMRARATRAPGDHVWYAALRRYFEAQGVRGPAAQALFDLERLLPGLPALEQHGDFVVNNLGLRPDRSLVVFDWEDYGAITLPGLDLFTLQNSLAGEAARQDQRHPSLNAADLAVMCSAMGLPAELYERLRPACALAFRYLKRNYAPGIRARADQLVDEALGVPA